jgi:hypothetical protein
VHFFINNKPNHFYMNPSINTKVIALFNRAMVSPNNFSFEVINKAANRLGYIVHPDVCNDGVAEFLNSMEMDINSTFYKSWTDVVDKNRLELFNDQAKHYASTYGTSFQGEVYIPSGDISLPELQKYKVILPITKDEIAERCAQMLYSGVALSQEVITDLVDIINDINAAIDIDKILNKESLMLFHEINNTIPSAPDEMVRYIVFLATRSTLLIKDQSTILVIKSSKKPISQLVNDFGYEKLATVFFRFKLIFLAFKTSKDNNHCVNKLRKLANEFHKPMSPNYFATLLSNPSLVDQLPTRLEGLNNFKKIGLLQTINVRLLGESHRFFPIRNQKLFIKENAPLNLSSSDVNYYNLVYDVIYRSLVSSLAKKATTIKIPNGISIKLPATAKSFIGNYPLGTSFDFSGCDNIVGINWKEGDGAHDLDLSLMSIDGTKYGWNAQYTNENNSIVYSGDMTYASPEATELFYTKSNFNPSLVRVNLYNGRIGSKFKFFLAKEPIDIMKQNYMVNPNNVCINVEVECKSRETILGVLTGSEFILAQFRTGSKIISDVTITDLYTEHALSTVGCFLDLSAVLNDAGFIIDNIKPEIDFTDLSKDTIISLLS